MLFINNVKSLLSYIGKFFFFQYDTIKEFCGFTSKPYINDELKKSIWTKDMQVSWNKRFVPNNFLSKNDLTIQTLMNYTYLSRQILNYINLDLKLQVNITIKVILKNLQSKNKIANDIQDLNMLNLFNDILSILSFEYLNTLKTQHEFVKVLNVIIFKILNNQQDINPIDCFTELSTLLSDPDLSNLEIRELLLSELHNDEISDKFIKLPDSITNQELFEGENKLELRVTTNNTLENEQENWIDYDLLINWSEKEEKYHYHHEILYKYFIDLENKAWNLTNNNNLTEQNKQSDLMQTVVEDVNNYYQIKKEEERVYYTQRDNLKFYNKDIALIFYKDIFFNIDSAPIKFLNANVLLKKGNNKVFVEISLDNYSQKFCYSIEI